MYDTLFGKEIDQQDFPPFLFFILIILLSRLKNLVANVSHVPRDNVVTGRL
jgi:hypothetical protein